ncbi:MAG: hypothetical protein V7L29_05660 [Nostoc sp.]|uniref:hypothetical protein n=1 Tax=Nostoc sp. TaxID=1180 RepID=UPI002FF23F4C
MTEIGRKSGRAFLFYVLTVMAAAITIEMDSQQIDSHLYLLLPAKERLIAQNDDIFPKDFNARLTVTLPENGIYYLLANTFEAEESGSYSLRAAISQQ